MQRFSTVFLIGTLFPLSFSTSAYAATATYIAPMRRRFQQRNAVKHEE